MPDPAPRTRGPHEPHDPGFAERVRASFVRQAWMRTLGATLVEVGPGRVSIEVAARPDLTQQHGYLHAGVLTSIADSACGYAAYSLMPQGSDVLSVEFKVNLLAPATGPVVRTEARVLRSGRTLTVCQADVFGGEAGDRHVATMVATIMRIEPRGTRREDPGSGPPAG